MQGSQPLPRIVPGTCQVRTRARILGTAERTGRLQDCMQGISSLACLLLDVVKICVLRQRYVCVAMYSPPVTICTISLTFTKPTFCPHSVFMCFVWISEQKAIISLYSIKQQIRNTWKVLKRGAGEEWRRSVGPIM